MQIVGGKKCMLATPVIGDCGRIWIVIAHELDSWCEPLIFFFLLFLNICSQSNLCSFFDYFSFCKRCGAVLRTESNPLQPRQSGWNVTTVLFIWASHFFLDISKVFLISILNLVLKANLSPTIYSYGPGVSGISAILEQFLWSANSWGYKPFPQRHPSDWILTMYQFISLTALPTSLPPSHTIRQGPCLIFFTSPPPSTPSQCPG